MPTLNEQQQLINQTLDKNVIVSASAGTGKTTVLTARMIDHIRRGNSISDYLVISFTEAAAGELKDRISAGLKKQMAEVPEEEKIRYRKEIAKIPLANISTIHSFCLEILKEYGYKLDIDPAIAGNLADDGTLAQIKDAALKEALDVHCHNDLIYRFNDRPEDISGLCKMVERADSFIENLDDPEGWIKDQEDLYEAFSKNDFSSYPEDLDQLFDELFNTIEKNETYNYEAYTRNLKNTTKTWESAVKYHERMGEILSCARRDLREKDYDKAVSYFLPLDKYPSINRFKVDDMIKEECNRNKDQIDNAVEKLKVYYKFSEANRENAAVVREFFDIVHDYHAAYERLKEENGVISFDDMLNKAGQILDVNDGEVAKIYRDKFKEILIDEYQDTNRKQENIVARIKGERNVFRVGDVKQSIYRFQNAKPEMMKDFIKNADPVKDKVLPLQLNYRSCPTIISFSNFIFNQLMNIDEKMYTPATDDLHIPDVNKDMEGKKIQLITVPFETDDKISEQGKEDKALRSFNAKEKTAFIAQYIASEIVHLKEEDKDLKWSDFAVLLRTNTHKGTFKKIFNEHNVPVYTVAKAGFFSDGAVSAVIALLNLIEKDSRLEAFNVLTSPLFDMDYEAIALDQSTLDIKEDDSDELSRLVHDLRRKKKEVSLIELMNEIYNYNGFYMEKVNSYQRNNLNSLYQLILDYRHDSDSIGDLLDYLYAFRMVDRGEGSSFTSKDDVVQVMTIHQSKGLQFRYVFIADLTFSSRNDAPLINLNEKKGIVPKYVSMPYKIHHENPYYDLVRNENAIEDFKEELRVFYVAVTRAKEGLYIVNAANDKEEDLVLDEEVLRKKGQMTWVRAALKNAGQDIKDLVETGTLSEADMKAHEMLAEADGNDGDPGRKFSQELIRKEEESFSPSDLEDTDIDTLNFDQGSGSQRGTLMHKAIELLKIRDVSISDIDALPFDLAEDDKKKILAFYENDFTKSIMNNENHHEYPFIYEDGGIRNGIIDLLSIGDEIFVIDFKSDRHTSPEKLRERYSDQLNAYKQIVEMAYPQREVIAKIYSFELKEFMQI